MGTVNKKSNRSSTLAPSKIEAESHTNFMASPSYDVTNPLVQLRMCAASSFFGEPMYYEDNVKKLNVTIKKAPTNSEAELVLELIKTLGDTGSTAKWASLSAKDRMLQAIDESLSFDVRETLELAVALRHEDHIRVTPQVILVRAANHTKAKGTGLVREYMNRIVGRVDDVVTQFAYQMSDFGRKVPNSLKRGWSDYLSRQPEYALAKYRMESRQYKLVDVVHFAHAKSEAIGKLMTGVLHLNENDTWEALISKNGSSKETWTKAVDLMGHMALLRNLNNFNVNGVDQQVYLPKLISTAASGKQLPFRYISAYNAIGDNAPAAVKDALVECLEESLGKIPTFKGRVMSLCDNSGSARGTTTSSMGTMRVADIANLTAVLTSKCSDDGYVGVFGDKLKTFSVGKRDNVFTSVKMAESLGACIGESTEHGIWLFWQNAIKKAEHWDHIFIYSDMQAGHGGLYGKGSYDEYVFKPSKLIKQFNYIDVPMLVADYRKKVNPNVQVYLVQVAGYRDTLVPEDYPKTHILGGWGDGILRYAARMADIESPGSVIWHA